MEAYPYPHPVRFLDLEVERRPVRMAYMDVAPTRNANGRSVLLLHGKNFYGSYWEGTIMALADAGYRVVVPDQTLGQYPELGKAAANDVPGAELLELPGVGHIPHLEIPDKFHSALLNFLGPQ